MTAVLPVQPSQRIFSLDVLRGFALFGVLLAYTSFEFGVAEESSYSRFEFYTGWGMEVFRDNKFYPILNFLFGLGFSMHLKKVSANTPGIAIAYMRRIAFIFFIGLVYSLIRENILMSYAFCGLILVPLRNVSKQTLLAVGLCTFCYSLAATEIWKLIGVTIPKAAQAENFFSAKLLNLKNELITGHFYWWSNLPLVLLGFYMGRSGMFNRISVHRNNLLKVIIAGFIIGVFFYVLREILLDSWRGTKINFTQRYSLRLLWWMAAWPIAAFYTCGILLLLFKQKWQDRFTSIAAVGRMALTNYILQGIVLVPIVLFFDLFDTSTPFLGLLVAVILFVLQVLFSMWWLKRYSSGPLEALLHRFAYGSTKEKDVRGKVSL